MSPTPTSKLQSVQHGIVSVRSRRLRAIGTVLLAGILLMSLYGVFGLMPTLRASSKRVNESRAIAASQGTVVQSGTGVSTPTVVTPEMRQSRKLARALAAQVIFAWIYWTVCALLLVGLLLIAWLDFRELSRQYDNERIALFCGSIGSGSAS